ncbi:hypothetical protein M23134_01102 [Microscilla marina ATCC 23134]|uniref:Uncharacterized protein n=1 Tax=Microscilla marina ATCC 23134 TaxID=313606 RepID=A1ZFK4_MICM2|nr:hypothetical protein M23134_01102 [Microscilla marina ATCC 23134]
MNRALASSAFSANFKQALITKVFLNFVGILSIIFIQV